MRTENPSDRTLAYISVTRLLAPGPLDKVLWRLHRLSSLCSASRYLPR